jgi:ferredoxin
MCIATAPGHFHLVDGYSEPRNKVLSPDDALVAAAELCPMSAILVREATLDDLTSLGSKPSPRSDG